MQSRIIDKDVGEVEVRGSRLVSFQELAGDIASFKPTPVRNRKRIRDTDPYFSVLDHGREFILQRKRCKEMVESLPKELQKIIDELDQLMKEMANEALNSEFDYQDQLNRYYFRMMQVNHLSSILRHRLRRFSKNQKAIETYLSGFGKKKVTEFLDKISILSTTANDLSLSCNLFMDHMEKDYAVLTPEQIKKRELVREQTMLLMS